MNQLVIKKKIHFENGRSGSRQIQEGAVPKRPPNRLPRITKLMSLAIRFDQLIRDGHITDQAELARLGQVSRARITQIMNLLNLAPEIQEAILFLPRVEQGRADITERELRPIVAEEDWEEQNVAFERFTFNMTK